MNLSELFVRRPVMTVLVMAGILIFGLASYRLLPVFPLPTSISPRSRFPRLFRREPGDHGRRGRNAPRETVLDDRGHRPDDLALRQGLTSITIQFALDRDIDALPRT